MKKLGSDESMVVWKSIASLASLGGDRHGLQAQLISGKESPKGGVGSPAGFARGAGREWALPVSETERRVPETT